MVGCSAKGGSDRDKDEQGADGPGSEDFPRRGKKPGVAEKERRINVETVCCLYHQKKDFISVPYKPRNADYLKRSSRSAVGNRGDDKL